MNLSTRSGGIPLPPGASPLKYAQEIVALLEEDFSAEVVSYEIRDGAVHVEVRIPAHTAAT
jgi:hypothetical protein